MFRVVGFAGALLLAAGAWGVEASGSTAALAVAVAGAGLVVLVWVLTARTVLAGALPPDGWSGRTLALWCAPVALAPPLFSRDVFSYLAQGAVAARGLDPHVVAPARVLAPGSAVLERVDGYWRATPSPYGPLSDGLQEVIAVLGRDDVVLGVALHRVVALLALVVIVAVLPRLGAVTGTAPETALVFGALNPLVLFHLVGGVHNDGPMLALMLAGTAVALLATSGSGGRWWVAAGGVLVALAVLVKAPAVVALAAIGIALARRHGGRAGAVLSSALAMVSGLCVVVALSSLVTGRGLSWVGATATPATLGSWMAPTNWFGFAAGGVGALFGVRITDEMVTVGRVAGAVATVVLVGLVLLGQLRGRYDPVTSLGLMFGAVVALGPVVHPWYLLWALTPLAVARIPPGARGGLVALVAVFAVLVPPLAGDFTGRVTGLVAGYVAAAVLVALAYVGIRRVTGPLPSRPGEHAGG